MDWLNSSAPWTARSETAKPVNDLLVDATYQRVLSSAGTRLVRSANPYPRERIVRPSITIATPSPGVSPAETIRLASESTAPAMT